MVCASVIIFMRSVYTIAYFDTPISTGFLKLQLVAGSLKVALLHIEYLQLQEKRQL